MSLKWRDEDTCADGTAGDTAAFSGPFVLRASNNGGWCVESMTTSATIIHGDAMPLDGDRFVGPEHLANAQAAAEEAATEALSSMESGRLREKRLDIAATLLTANNFTWGKRDLEEALARAGELMLLNENKLLPTGLS